MQTPIEQALQKIDSAIEMWKTPTKEMDALKTLVTLYQEISALQNSSEKTITITEQDGKIYFYSIGFSSIETLGALKYYEDHVSLEIHQSHQNQSKTA